MCVRANEHVSACECLCLCRRETPGPIKQIKANHKPIPRTQAVVCFLRAYNVLLQHAVTVTSSRLFTGNTLSLVFYAAFQHWIPISSVLGLIQVHA